MDYELETNLIQRIAVGDIFRRRAAAAPQAMALKEQRGDKQISLTFGQLNDKLNCFASAAKKMGLEQGDRISILGLNSVEYLIALYGCAKGGFTALPVNPGISSQDIIYVVNHARARCLVLDSMLMPLIDKIKDSLKTVQHFIVIKTGDESMTGYCISFDSFLKSGSDQEVEDIIIKDRDIFEILYTSGTTGRPKGVLISHLSAYISSLSTAIEFGLGRYKPSTMLLPVFHCAQQVVTLSTLNLGGSVSIFRQFDPEQVLEILEKDQISLIFALPIMYGAMLNYPDAHKKNVQQVDKCVYAIAPMAQTMLQQGRKFFQAEFLHGTGQTECLPSTNIFRSDYFPDKQGNYWGDSNITLDTMIMDDDGNILPKGQVGEIVWRGPVVMESYLEDDGATRESRKFGWHHSGDLGLIDEDGQLLFVDRKKDMIKTGGENVASVNVERIILEDHRIEQAAVVGIPHEKWGEEVTAFVVPMEGAQITEKEIIEKCKKFLGKFEIPKKVIIQKELPVTSTGKVRKNIIRQMEAKA